MFIRAITNAKVIYIAYTFEIIKGKVYKAERISKTGNFIIDNMPYGCSFFKILEGSNKILNILYG